MAILRNGETIPKLLSESRHEAIAMEYAAGSSINQLCARFGYTYGGMYKLLEDEDMKLLVASFQQRITDQLVYMQAKLMLRLPELIEMELAVALPEDGTNAASPAAQKSRHYLIDKVMPTVQRVESTVNHALQGEAKEVAAEVRTLLTSLNDHARQRRSSIIDSPHVHEGAAALPTVAGPSEPSDG